MLVGPSRTGGAQELRAFLAAADRTSPELTDARASVEARGAERAVAAAGLWPRLEVQGRALHNEYAAETYVPVGPAGQAQRVTIVPAEQLDLTAGLAWPIVDGARWGEMQALVHAKEAACADLARRRLELHRTVVRAFFEHAAAVETLAAAAQAVESATAFVRLARLRLEAGEGAPLDLARALADEADRRQSVAESRRSIAVAAARLESSSGLPVERVSPMPPSLLRPAGPMPADAVERHPELAAAQEAALAAGARVDASRAAWLPTLAATATEAVTNYAGFTGRSASYVAGVVATLPVDLARWRTTALRSALATSAEAAVGLARRRVKERLAVDRAAADAAVASLEAARARADAAALAARLVFERFDAGAATSFEVVSSRRDSFLAQAALASARAALAAAHAALRLSAGLDALPPDASPGGGP